MVCLGEGSTWTWRACVPFLLGGALCRLIRGLAGLQCWKRFPYRSSVRLVHPSLKEGFWNLQPPWNCLVLASIVHGSVAKQKYVCNHRVSGGLTLRKYAFVSSHDFTPWSCRAWRQGTRPPRFSFRVPVCVFSVRLLLLSVFLRLRI